MATVYECLLQACPYLNSYFNKLTSQTQSILAVKCEIHEPNQQEDGDILKLNAIPIRSNGQKEVQQEIEVQV